MKTIGRKWRVLALIVMLLFLCPETVVFAQELLEEMEFTQIQNMMDQMLKEDSFSVTEMIRKIMSGEEAISLETVQKYLYRLFFERPKEEKEFFVQILLCVFMAAVFSAFSNVFGSGQIGEISFYMTYLMLFISIANTFFSLTETLSKQIYWLTDFMKIIAPSFFMAVAVSGGMSTAIVFQEGILLLSWALQWILGGVLLPLACMYMLIKMVNNLSKEELLGKMADLMNTLICWGTKTILGTMVGFQAIRGLTAPVIDALKRGTLGKTIGSIPGIGNAVNSVTELLLTSAVLVRNTLGTVFMLVLVLAAFSTVIQYAGYSLGMRFMAALAEPVSDKRIVGCLQAMGEGCGILLRILFTAQILCMVDILLLLANFGSGK